MVTLEQLVKNQKYTGESDIRVIKTFFDLNDMEEEGVDLILKLKSLTVKKECMDVRTVIENTMVGEFLRKKLLN